MWDNQTGGKRKQSSNAPTPDAKDPPFMPSMQWEGTHSDGRHPELECLPSYLNHGEVGDGYSVLAFISFTLPLTRSPAALILPLARSPMAFTLLP